MNKHELKAAFESKRNQLHKQQHELNDLGLSNDHRIEAVNDMEDILIPGGMG